MNLALDLGGAPDAPDCLTVTVFGTARPAGSKRAFVRGKRAIVVDDNAKSKPWKTQVAQIVGEAMDGRPVMEGALAVTFRFVVPRPKGHFTSTGALSASGKRRPFPTVKPDVLKLARAVEDALTGVAYRDDAQIVDERLVKVYGSPERVEIEITPAKAVA